MASEIIVFLGLILTIFFEKNSNMAAHKETPKGSRNEVRWEKLSMIKPPRTGPENPDIETPIANHEKTMVLFSGLLSAPM